ncbi:MAG: hypothetical protein V4640_02145 [Verrucomicrobiota bacterium]
MSKPVKSQSASTQPSPCHEASSIASFIGKNYYLISAVVIALGVFLRAWLSYETVFSIGDSYIGFRFAEQFAAGNGLVFNIGEKVGGNTSILYSFILDLGACTGASIRLVAGIRYPLKISKSSKIDYMSPAKLEQSLNLRFTKNQLFYNDSSEDELIKSLRNIYK